MKGISKAMKASTPLEEAAFAAFDSESEDETSEEEAEVSSVEEEETEEESAEDAPEEPAEEESTEDDSEEEELESFTGIDPNELSDELKPIYKSLQADYTRKRQADSERVKKLEAELAELRKTSEQSPDEARGKKYPDDIYEGIDPNLSPEERMREVARRVARQEQKIAREEAWEEEATKEIEVLEPRLNEHSPNFDPRMDVYVRTELDNRLAEYIQKEGSRVGFDYKGVLKELSNDWDTYVESLNKSYVQRQKKLAKEKEAKLKKANPKSSPASSKKNRKMDIDDAIMEAFSENS